jgi:YggT family protein
MLFQIFSLILEVACGLIGGACLLRAYMQYLRIPMTARSGNPLGRIIFVLTDWLVLPLRRVLPAAGPLDTSSLLGAYVMELFQFGTLWMLTDFAASGLAVFLLAFFGLLRLTLSVLTGLVIVFALMSWLQGQNLLAHVIERLVNPVLEPVRRLLPRLGGIDLSPLVLLVLLQVLAIVVSHVQASVIF